MNRIEECCRTSVEDNKQLFDEHIAKIKERSKAVKPAKLAKEASRMEYIEDGVH